MYDPRVLNISITCYTVNLCACIHTYLCMGAFYIYLYMFLSSSQSICRSGSAISSSHKLDWHISCKLIVWLYHQLHTHTIMIFTCTLLTVPIVVCVFTVPWWIIGLVVCGNRMACQRVKVWTWFLRVPDILPLILQVSCRVGLCVLMKHSNYKHNRRPNLGRQPP